MESQAKADYFDPFGEVEGAEALPLDQAITQFREFHTRKREPGLEAIQDFMEEAKRVEVCLFRSIMGAGQ